MISVSIHRYGCSISSRAGIVTTGSDRAITAAYWAIYITGSN